MKYNDLENSLIKLKPVFSLRDIAQTGFKVFPYQLSKWAKEGKIKRLAGGFYVFAKAEVSVEHIANQLREPSYISLEYALYYHGLTVDIPFHVTSVTARGTRNIVTPSGTFFYHHIKPTMFDGFVMQELGDHDEVGKRFLIATPEKALIDLFYLNPKKYNSQSDFEEARFHEEDLKTKMAWDRMLKLAGLFGNKALVERLLKFKKYIFSV